MAEATDSILEQQICEILADVSPMAVDVGYLVACVYLPKTRPSVHEWNKQCIALSKVLEALRIGGRVKVCGVGVQSWFV